MKIKGIEVDKTNTWLCVIDVDALDIGIDPATEDGREELGALACCVNRCWPHVVHFLFKQKGKQIGEMLITPGLDKHN